MRLAETRRAAAVLFAVSLAVWWLEAIVIPLGPGRDLGTYLGGYVQLFQSHPIDLGYVLGRTPIAMLVVGGLLDLAGGALAEAVMSILYALSIVAWFLAARTFGTRAAVLTAVVLLLYPGYGILFHELSSDAVFAAAFAGWALLVVRVLRAPSTTGWAFVGAGVGVLALVRPGNQVLLAVVLLPLLLARSWRARTVGAAAFLVPALILIGGWVVHNGVRYDNYTLARGGNATVPFFRAFVTDKIVRPSNGPKTEELARAVRRDLLPTEPYRSYGVTLDEFFTEASPRMQVDLLALSDRLKGWHSNYRWLRDVGMEAVDEHPARFTRGVLGSVSGMLRLPLYRSSPATADTQANNSRTTVAGGRLPTPSEGEPIPAPHEGGVTTPDFSIYTVWTSPTEHHLVFVHAGDEERYNALHRRMGELADDLPTREGSPSLAHRLNQTSRWFPPPVLWLALALVALAVRRLLGGTALWVPALAGIAVIVLTALGLPAEPHYSVPVAPAFVLLAGGALFARRRELVPVAGWRAAWPGISARVAPVLATALVVLAAVWALRRYVSVIHGAFEHDRAPHDLAVFLDAAGKVMHAASPYAYRADDTYAYPPLLAWLMVPLHPLGAAAATVIWTLLGLVAIAVSLWFLGVRDWRCYALAAAFPFTRSSIALGTIAPLLLLATAATWRWRARLLEPAVAVGAGIALKLLLWPLALWLALTGRRRAAATAAALAAVFVVVPWAVIGFPGIGDYPGLLRHVSRDEASSSYSVVALVVRAHLPEAAGIGVSLAVALALLGAALWVWRSGRGTLRDREVATFTLALAAALAASPIVWVHYFVLLLVPLALTRPRLSLLWFVPFAYLPLGESAWPAGDARKLALALVTTLTILGAALWTSLREPRTSSEELRPFVPVGLKDVLVVFDIPDAGARYRAEHLAEQLACVGLSADVAQSARVDLGGAVGHYRRFVLNRVEWNDGVGALLEGARAADKPVVFDTDDLVFEPELARHFAFMENWPAESRRVVIAQLSSYGRTLEACGAATVSTDPLAEAARRHVPDVEVVYNCVSIEMMRLADAALPSRRRNGGDGVTIAYLSGTRTHDRDFLEAADAVLEVLERHPRARLLVVGKLTLDGRFDRLRRQVSKLPLRPWGELPRILAGVDINLAPLERDNPLTECKSCVKYLEAGLMAVPTVASANPDFVRATKGGETALLARTPGEWRESLQSLVESPALRNEIGARARADVLEHHTTQSNARFLPEALTGIGVPV